MSIFFDILPDSHLSIVLLLVLIIFTYSFYKQHLCDRHLPHKIRGFPIIGILPYLVRARSLETLCVEWREIYGDVFTIYIGMTPIVILTSYESVKETLKKRPEVFSSRPDLYTVKKITLDGQGIVFHQYGDTWKDSRKFTLQVLRDFGVGKTSLEEKILEEVESLRCEINSKHGSGGKPFNPQKILQSAVSNIICNINFGSRFEYDDPEFQNVTTSFNEIARSIGPGNIAADFFPLLKYIPQVNRKLTHCLQQMDTIHKYIRARIDEHRATFDSTNIRDFIDLYIKAEEDGKISKYISESQMFQIIADMFAAGTETTSTTLYWALLYLCHYPQIQKRIHEELDQTIGSGHYAKLKDKESVPYSNAFLLEVQRHVTIVPMNVPHAAGQDCQFRNFQIAKGTMIMPSLYCVHRDEKYFPDSETFNPERWLNGEGKVVHIEAFIPFSTGYRTCLGEQLAKMELFLFFCGLLHMYNIRGHGKLPALSNAYSTFVRQPQPYQIRMEKREN